MRERSGEPVRCKLLCEYVDEAAEQQDIPTTPQSEVVRARLVASYTDTAERPAPNGERQRDFVVLTLDNRSITVRGHDVECGPDGVRQVVRYEGGQKVCVAVFEGSRIVGIYEGTSIPTG
jgi:hypothetical protein